MTDNTSNPFYDAWVSASEQLMKTQTSWFANFVDTSEETIAASDVVERAKQNWDQCEAQFNSWISAAEQWSASTTSSSKASSKEGADENNDAFEKLKRLLNPETFLRSGVDEINQVFQRYAEGPDFADFGVLEKKFMRTSQDWLNLRNASAEYQTIITKAWAQAFDIYVKEISNQSNQDAADTHEMMQLWLKVANDSLIQVQRSEEFLAAQSNLFKTNTRYKLKQREIIESWCENFTMPTRTEVDDLHRMVYDLRREVRQLKTQLKTTSQPQSKEEPQSEEKLQTKKKITAKKNQGSEKKGDRYTQSHSKKTFQEKSQQKG